ncbi:MAG TPA: nicotinate-nucleotide adenylyltransferase [Xanthobacteraceae bacterium]|nr:nicotinate-nucleotide adenylyltransferase [Xanthobacteraceae bacterium]
MKREIRVPPVFRGMRIGLLGGSFNPPHAAHRALSLLALKRLALDRVWWLVTPGNPLKDNRRLPPLAKRLAAARALAAHGAIDVTAIEAALGTRYTYDTVLALSRRFPGVHFVFIMGADNLAQLNRWRRWRELASLVPIAVIDRPDRNLAARASPAAMALARARIDGHEARTLALRKPPAWVFLHGLKSNLSSTALRSRGTHIHARS